LRPTSCHCRALRMIKRWLLFLVSWIFFSFSCSALIFRLPPRRNSSFPMPSCIFFQQEPVPVREDKQVLYRTWRVKAAATCYSVCFNARNCRMIYEFVAEQFDLLKFLLYRHTL
jgi:hypothetical protein